LINFFVSFWNPVGIQPKKFLFELEADCHVSIWQPLPPICDLSIRIEFSTYSYMFLCDVVSQETQG